MTELIISFLTLCILEIVLGIDNLIFISILSSRLPESKQKLAQRVGLFLAMLLRLLMLLSVSWLMKLTDPLFSVLEFQFSGKDLILLFGGLFLIGKSTHEIYNTVELGPLEKQQGKTLHSTLGWTLFQIVLLDLVFSLDSVITAVGLADSYWVMAVAMIIAVIVMILMVSRLHSFVIRHPSVKVLALSFLMLVGVMLLADGFNKHFPRAYIYFAMGFSIFVEVLNIRRRARVTPT